MFTSSFTAILAASSLTATFAAPQAGTHTSCASSVSVDVVSTGTPFAMQPDVDLATGDGKAYSSSQEMFHALPVSNSSLNSTSTHCASPSTASTSTFLVRQHFTLAQRQAQDWAVVTSAPAMPPAAQTPAQDWAAANPQPTPAQNWDAAAPNMAPTPAQTWAVAAPSTSTPVLAPASTPAPPLQPQETYKPSPDHFGSRAMLAVFIGIGIVILIVLVWSIIAWRRGQNPFACCGGFPGWPRKHPSGERSLESGDVEAKGSGDGDLHRVGAGRHYARRPVSEALELQLRQQWPQPAFQHAQMGVAAQRDPMAPLPPRVPGPAASRRSEAEWAREF